jgi:hypothetical protein
LRISVVRPMFGWMDGNGLPLSLTGSCRRRRQEPDGRSIDDAELSCGNEPATRHGYVRRLDVLAVPAAAVRSPSWVVVACVLFLVFWSQSGRYPGSLWVGLSKTCKLPSLQRKNRLQFFPCLFFFRRSSPSPPLPHAHLQSYLVRFDFPALFRKQQT